MKMNMEIKKIFLFFYKFFGFYISFVSVEIDPFKGVIVNEIFTVSTNSCSPVVRLQPKINLNNFFNETRNGLARLNLKVTFRQKKTDKGCSRDTYDVIQRYERCKASRSVELLPSSLAAGKPYVEHVKYIVSPKGGLDYVFDGGTAVRYKTSDLPTNWFEAFTISGWVMARYHDERQYVVSWSDGDTERHDNMGFYVTRRTSSNHVVFGFHHMHNIDGTKCMIKKKWRIPSDKVHWNFFTLSFKQCVVELHVDGDVLDAVTSQSHFRLPEKHIQPKFVIGARWAGSLKKYDNYLNGRISGLMLTPKLMFKDKINQCILECSERLEYSKTSARLLIDKLNNEGNHLTVVGDITRTNFIKVLSNVVYFNDNEMELTTEQNVEFKVKDVFTNHVETDLIPINIVRKQPKVTIDGDCTGPRDSLLFAKQGIRLCTNLRIDIEGCVNTIDMLTVTMQSDLTKNEKLYIGSAYLRRHHLTLKYTPKGFVVYGIATVKQYTEILYHIRYSYNGYLRHDIVRPITISLASKNGLLISNIYKMKLIANADLVAMVPDNYTPTRKKTTETQQRQPVKKKYEIINALSHDSFLPFNKRLAGKSNKIKNHGSTIWLVLAATFSIVVVISVVGYGAIQWKSHRITGHQPLEEEEFDEDVPAAAQNPSADYFWDEEGLPMTLTINPSERVSISNDPYADILVNKDSFLERLTEDSTCSDCEDTEFETDSIRQLEWDCLENSIETILLNDDESNESSSDTVKTTIL